MSYILDALRRAEAERERGAVPGLQSQQHAYVEDDASKPQRPRALVWAIVALAAALVAAVVWNFVGGGGQPAPRPVVEGSVSSSSTTPVLLPTTPTTAVSSTAVPSPQAVAPQAPQAPQAVAPQAVAPQAVAPQAVAPAPAPSLAELPTASPAAVPRPHAAAKPAAEPRRVARRSAEPQTATAATELKALESTPAPKAAGATGETRVYQQSELPEDVRRDLPKLVIGGASYSGDAASRMVMINGQIFHEGDQLAPQLVLERIKLKSAVLSYKGYRYELTF